MLVLIAIGVAAWLFSCVLVVCLCVMAARGDGRQARPASTAEVLGAPTYLVIP